MMNERSRLSRRRARTVSVITVACFGSQFHLEERLPRFTDNEFFFLFLYLSPITFSPVVSILLCLASFPQFLVFLREEVSRETPVATDHQLVEKEVDISPSGEKQKKKLRVKIAQRCSPDSNSSPAR